MHEYDGYGKFRIFVMNYEYSPHSSRKDTLHHKEADCR